MTDRAAEPEIEGLPAPGWIALSFVVYVVLGLAFRTVVLNWIVGPLWLLLTLYVLPTLGRSLLARVGRR